jgi:hypothetical protein
VLSQNETHAHASPMQLSGEGRLPCSFALSLLNLIQSEDGKIVGPLNNSVCLPLNSIAIGCAHLSGD